jgi:hypothetical protein
MPAAMSTIPRPRPCGLGFNFLLFIYTAKINGYTEEHRKNGQIAMMMVYQLHVG